MTDFGAKRAPDAEEHPCPLTPLPIPLFDGVVLAARSGEGLIFLDLRDLCSTLGLDVASQRRRILATEELRLAPFCVTVGGQQLRTRDFLLLDDVPVWLLSMQQRRVAPEVRERFSYVKTYLVAAVRQAFAQLTGLPDAPSSAIEDLGDLEWYEKGLWENMVLPQTLFSWLSRFICSRCSPVGAARRRFYIFYSAVLISSLAANCRFLCYTSSYSKKNIECTCVESKIYSQVPTCCCQVLPRCEFLHFEP